MQRVLQEPVGNQLENLLKLFYKIQSEGDDIVGKVRGRIIESLSRAANPIWKSQIF
jgi:hypothetical protein